MYLYFRRLLMKMGFMHVYKNQYIHYDCLEVRMLNVLITLLFNLLYFTFYFALLYFLLMMQAGSFVLTI